MTQGMTEGYVDTGAKEEDREGIAVRYFFTCFSAADCKGQKNQCVTKREIETASDIL
jgi:hypothetical protein